MQDNLCFDFYAQEMVSDATPALMVVEATAPPDPPAIDSAKPKEQRTYQTETVLGVEQALLDGHKRVAVVLPTGAGKTYTSRLVLTSPIIRQVCGVPETRPLRVLFAAHIDRLLQQAVREYTGDPLVEIIPQSAYSAVPQEVIEAGWDVVCIDECHHEAMRTYQDQLEIMGNTPILGLTATPDRDDGKLIKFSAIVEPISRAEAVRQGYLAQSVLNTIVDESGPDKRELLSALIPQFAPLMGQTLVFVATHAEVMHVHTLLQQLGYKSVALVDTLKAETNRILDAFSDGEIQFIVNCSKVDEGVDVVGCTDVFLGRQFGSKRLINQTIGRAARPDSPCNIWELVDPLETKYTATDIVHETEAHYLIYLDHERNTWERVPYAI